VGKFSGPDPASSEERVEVVTADPHRGPDIFARAHVESPHAGAHLVALPHAESGPGHQFVPASSSALPFGCNHLKANVVREERVGQGAAQGAPVRPPHDGPRSPVPPTASLTLGLGSSGHNRRAHPELTPHVGEAGMAPAEVAPGGCPGRPTGRPWNSVQTPTAVGTVVP
jgi:hypothetical protein